MKQQLGSDHFTVISFWCGHPAYRDAALRLIADCERLGLRHDITELPGSDSWMQNTRRKPQFILDALRKHRRPVLWVDADSSVLRHPGPMLDLDCDVGAAALAARNTIRVLGYPDITIASAALFFNYRSPALDFLEEWTARTQGEIPATDHLFLGATWATTKARKRILPPHFCQEHRSAETVILQGRFQHEGRSADMQVIRDSRGRTRIYRITPPGVRSRQALDSVAGLPVHPIPAVEPAGDSLRAREIACSLAHAAAMQTFLAGSDQFAVVLEDDAVLSTNREWIAFTQFDLFIPFASHRQKLPPEATIRPGVLPKYGTQAYLCSRAFAERYLPLLLAGGIADHVSHVAARGLRVGSFAGNLVQHDTACVSLISEERRRLYLQP